MLNPILTSIVTAALTATSAAVWSIMRLTIITRSKSIRSKYLRDLVVSSVIMTDQLFSEKSSEYKFQSTLVGAKDQIKNLITDESSLIDKKAIELLANSDLSTEVQDIFLSYKRSQHEQELYSNNRLVTE